MTSLSFPRSREEYDELRRKLEALGVTVKTPWREGLHSIRLGDIVNDDPRPDPQCVCGMPRHHPGPCAGWYGM